MPLGGRQPEQMLADDYREVKLLDLLSALAPLRRAANHGAGRLHLTTKIAACRVRLFVYLRKRMPLTIRQRNRP